MWQPTSKIYVLRSCKKEIKMENESKVGNIYIDPLKMLLEKLGSNYDIRKSTYEDGPPSRVIIYFRAESKSIFGTSRLKKVTIGYIAKDMLISTRNNDFAKYCASLGYDVDLY